MVLGSILYLSSKLYTTYYFKLSLSNKKKIVKKLPVNEIEFISSQNSTNAIFYYFKPNVYFPFDTLSWISFEILYFKML